MSKLKHLTYDGSYLGDFNFGDVLSYIAPCDNYDPVREIKKKSLVLFALFKFEGHNYPVVLKRNRMCRTDQAFVDQIKPLFGLRKMGCHRLRLNGIPVKFCPGICWLDGYQPNNRQMNITINPGSSEFYIFQSTIDVSENEQQCHRQLIPLSSYSFADPEYKCPLPIQQKILQNLRKICIFREIMGISETTFGDVLVATNPEFYLLSIDEMKIQPSREERSVSTNRKLNFPEVFRKILFPDESMISQICMDMINCNSQNYLERLDAIRDSMYVIAEKIDEKQYWKIQLIIDNLKSYIELAISCSE